MSNLTIGVIVGSLRKASFNRQLAHALIGLLPAGATAKIIEIGELPLYNQDLDGNLPEPVQRFKAEVAGVDALLFVTPEYNRGIPGVLKNAIDWGSRVGRQASGHCGGVTGGNRYGFGAGATAQRALGRWRADRAVAGGVFPLCGGTVRRPGRGYGCAYAPVPAGVCRPIRPVGGGEGRLRRA